jgi:hypothetical protein
VEAEGDGVVVAKSAGQQAALDELLAKYAKAADPETEPEDGDNDDPAEKGGGRKRCADTKKSNTNQKEETDTMKLQKSKMTPDELATLEALEKKYGTAEPDGDGATGAPAEGDGVAKGADSAGTTTAGAAAAPELHPDVKKALDDNKALTAQLEAMQKSLDIKDLTAVAKKYEIIGKKADELAPKLYDLKKAGGTAYDDTIALLDEQVVLVEKSGMFGEIGSGRSGAAGTDTELGAKAAEIKKSNAGISTPEAINSPRNTNRNILTITGGTHNGIRKRSRAAGAA